MPVEIFHNLGARQRGAYPFEDILRAADAEQAYELVVQCPIYQPTPLHRLGAAARELGISEIWYKDESRRLGMTSFKSLGGPYAVGRLLGARLGRDGRDLTFSELIEGKARGLAAGITVATASDGNHGRAVAAGARLFGCQCTIFLHEGVSKAREQAITDLGAQVVRTAGHYDDSVAEASRVAEANGWQLVPDTSDDASDPVPILVMQGYMVIVREVLDQLAQAGAELPTHVLVQGGVGALAASIVATFWETLGEERAPQFIVVEPDRADCLLRSARAGRPTQAEGDLDTIMAGLACGEVSMVAWPILEAGVERFVTITDEAIPGTMRRLADGSLGARIEAGETGCVGMAALLAIDRSRLGMDAGSRVLVIGTEGASDPEIYRAIVSEA